MRERLEEIIKFAFNNNKAEFARALGVVPQQVSDYLRKGKFGGIMRDKLKNVGIDYGYLETGIGSPFANNEAGKSLRAKYAPQSVPAPKETKDAQSHNTPQARGRWALVREWLTITGTITEWYFLVQSHCDGVTLNELLAVEAGEVDPPPVLVLWILASGVSIDWLIGIPEAPPFSDSEEGRDLEAKLRARYTKSTAPVEGLLLV